MFSSSPVAARASRGDGRADSKSVRDQNRFGSKHGSRVAQHPVFPAFADQEAPGRPKLLDEAQLAQSIVRPMFTSEAT